MSNSVVTISPDLLPPELAQRFAPLFEVAARKSLRSWETAPLHEADVLVIDARLAVSEEAAKANCVICIGTQVRTAWPPTTWVSWLPAQFTVADLIGTLDRAAIHVHEMRSRKISQSSAQVARIGAVNNVYRITSWAVLPPPFDTPGCLRGMAVLSRGALSLEQLCQHSQLDPAMAQQLLQQLAKRGLLTVLERPSHPTSKKTPVNTPSRTAPGLLQRLSKWVLLGGRA